MLPRQPPTCLLLQALPVWACMAADFAQQGVKGNGCEMYGDELKAAEQADLPAPKHYTMLALMAELACCNASILQSLASFVVHSLAWHCQVLS